MSAPEEMPVFPSIERRANDAISDNGVILLLMQQVHDKIEEFNKGFTDLVDEDVTVALPKIKLSEMGSVEVEPAHLVALADMFIDE